MSFRLIGVVLLTTLAPTCALSAQLYSVEDLPLQGVSGGEPATTSDIDAKGRVLAAITSAGVSQRCTPKKCRLLKVKGESTLWNATNATGSTAGTVRVNGRNWAARNMPGQPVERFFSDAVANDINAAGLTVGSTTSFRAFRFDGVFRFLPLLSGGWRAGANAVNDEGVVAGTASNEQGYERAVRWVDGQIQNLGSLGGAISRSFAYAINAHGVVVGCSNENVTTQLVAARFNLDGSITRIGTLGDWHHDPACANAINDAGVVVGTSGVPTGSGDAAFVYEDGVLSDLNSRIAVDDQAKYELIGAQAINNSGQIAVKAIRRADNAIVALRLTPAQ